MYKETAEEDHITATLTGFKDNTTKLSLALGVVKIIHCEINTYNIRIIKAVL